jgi:hypothetical protein
MRQAQTATQQTSKTGVLEIGTNKKKEAIVAVSSA